MSNIAQKMIDLATFAGTAAITTLGTITTGVWNGSVIAAAYIGAVAASAANAIPKAGSDGKIASGWGLPRILVAARQGTTSPADTAKNAVYTYSIPANTLSTSKVLRFRFILHKTSGSNSIAVAAEYNGSAMHATMSTTLAGFELEILLYGDGATNAQRSHVTTQTFSTGGGTVTTIKNFTAYSHDQTGALNLILYVTKTSGSDVMTLDYVEITQLET